MLSQNKIVYKELSIHSIQKFSKQKKESLVVKWKLALENLLKFPKIPPF